MLARISTFAVEGVDSRHVWVEADVRTGLPAFTIVGLGDKAVQEARERVRTAIVNSGFEFPMKRITINLAPAFIRKIGPGFDLPVALALLVAAEELNTTELETIAAVGELSLTGKVRGVPGTLAIAEGAHRWGKGSLITATKTAPEAALIDGLEVVGIDSLKDGMELITGAVPRQPAEPAPISSSPSTSDVDMQDVHGHNALIPGLTVAAAGGHNVYMHGPPGTGKTMLARRLPTILPPLSSAEAIAVTRIHSIAGLLEDGALLTERPFRSPHHTISAPGIVGGGTQPTPGEATLAHNGVLFLDELPEFSRSTLEALRQPIEDGRVVIVRGQTTMIFPTRFMLVAAANPCPCGFNDERCRCTAAELSRYTRRLSGAILDRVDIVLSVDRPDAERLRNQVAPSSASLREQVIMARERQSTRYAGTSITCNAEVPSKQLTERLEVTTEAMNVLDRLHTRKSLSARGYTRVLKVARTIADLASSSAVEGSHVMQAAAYRVDFHSHARAA